MDTTRSVHTSVADLLGTLPALLNAACAMEEASIKLLEDVLAMRRRTASAVSRTRDRSVVIVRRYADSITGCGAIPRSRC